MHNERQDGFPITTLREISTLRKVSDHPNCIKLREIAVGSRRDSVYLVFDYCEHDLAALVDANKTPFTESEIKTLSMQLLSAVDYLHTQYIIHRDIKLSNLLYNHRCQLKLADFGLARKYSGLGEPQRMTQKVVSLWYRAPELLLGSNLYGPPVDCWAVGCVLGELLNKKPLIPGKNEMDQISLIFALLGAPTERIWPSVEIMPMMLDGRLDLRIEQMRHQYSHLPSLFRDISADGVDILMRLLAYDPEKRLTASNALAHVYFRQSPFPKQEALMPTFRTLHDDSRGIDRSAGGHKENSKDSGQTNLGLGLGYKRINCGTSYHNDKKKSKPS